MAVGGMDWSLMDLPDYSVDLPRIPLPGIVDTHCHLDYLLKKLPHSLRTLGEFRKFLPESEFPWNFQGCVGVFCEPSFHADVNKYSAMLGDPDVWGAFGVHPHYAAHYNETSESNLITALKHPSVRALGEIGLDYSARNECDRQVQKEVFERQLTLATTFGMPVIIHCRDADYDCLHIMKKVLPQDYLIHRHCYTGNWEMAQEWMRTFPNLFLGLTPLVTFRTAKEVHEVAAKIPLEKLLFETDAPYFVPRKVRKEMYLPSHPGYVIHTAAQIASLRTDVTLEEMLLIVRGNTNRMYNI